MKERLFIQKAKEQVKLREFIKKQFAQAKCGEVEIQYTPVVTRIVLHNYSGSDNRQRRGADKRNDGDTEEGFRH